jgi:hypothetical protein
VEYCESVTVVRRQEWRISTVVWERIKYAAAGLLFIASMALLLAMPD